jgi:hypothetical protein
MYSVHYALVVERVNGYSANIIGKQLIVFFIQISSLILNQQVE